MAHPSEFCDSIPPHEGAIEPAWRTPTVLDLAAGIEAGAAFDRLPILADALEEAGCTWGDLLTHCRSGTAHSPECWAVAAALGKGTPPRPQEPAAPPVVIDMTSIPTRRTGQEADEHHWWYTWRPYVMLFMMLNATYRGCTQGPPAQTSLDPAAQTIRVEGDSLRWVQPDAGRPDGPYRELDAWKPQAASPRK